MGMINALSFQLWNMANSDGAGVHRIIRKTPNGHVEVMRVGDVEYVKTVGGGKFTPYIYITLSEYSDWCLVWKIILEGDPDYDPDYDPALGIQGKVATDIPINGTSELAAFPCLSSTISNWKSGQIETATNDNLVGGMYGDISGTVMYCGRDEAFTGELEQQCDWALDAVGEMDSRYDTQVPDPEPLIGPSHATSDIEIFSYLKPDSKKPQYNVLASMSAEVADLNSSVWYRNYYQLDSTQDRAEGVHYHSWGNVYEPEDHHKHTLYEFYGVGAPFGEPFHTYENTSDYIEENYCKNHGSPPTPETCLGWEESKSSGTDLKWIIARTKVGVWDGNYYNDASMTLNMSKNIILHVAHIAYIVEVQYRTWDTGTAPQPANTYEERVDALKVNLDYNKNGLTTKNSEDEDVYDLSIIPVAAVALKTAIQELIDKIYEEEGLSDYETLKHTRLDIKFYGASNI